MTPSVQMKNYKISVHHKPLQSLHGYIHASLMLIDPCLYFVYFGLLGPALIAFLWRGVLLDKPFLGRPIRRPSSSPNVVVRSVKRVKRFPGRAHSEVAEFGHLRSWHDFVFVGREEQNGERKAPDRGGAIPLEPQEKLLEVGHIENGEFRIHLAWQHAYTRDEKMNQFQACSE